MCIAVLRSPGDRPPWMLKLRSSTGFIIATVWMSCFTEFVLYAMIVPVMPTALVTRAGVPYEEREYWVSVLLMAESGVALLCCPIFGYLVDISGTRQPPFLFGLVLLGASMAIFAAARDVSWFVLARLLQGGATAMVTVGGLALLTDSVEAEHLGQTIGYTGSAITLGFLLGPLLGGLIYENLGYTAVFMVAFAVISGDLLLRVLVIEKQVASRWTKPTTTTEEETATAHGPSRPGDQFALIRLVKQPRILISSWALLVHGIIFAAFDSTLPVYVESRYGWNTFGAGMIFLPASISSLFEPVFGYLSDRYGARKATFTGFLLLAPSLICLRFTEENSTAHIALLVTLLVLIGMFTSLAIPALYAETQTVLDELEARDPGIFGPKGATAQAFGIQTMAQFVGLFAGPVWGGFIDHRFGWKAMSASLGVLAGITSIPMLWLSDDPENADDDEESRRPLLT
ncbi:hypothetical protein ASPZODRAFT_2000289 [Penicilliopsis zonata CBS 506.65]|uniref:Major facilitator superfamily (MFS) profile domain-containing protein n=1 Tax=Penicilliopsis zonata CBS 506.65 TaxID=1073090 RepID=A0A1L9SI16_9EURO|nr:hypothetical protein ASPZODRAFT_2000289 [Penicilliopsis zonata CBS 506.65]OJJ46684.1 hypothetical protein ASPZODRAFT_2000289 [Penicilliopsis zonata CBS 506.65]